VRRGPRATGKWLTASVERDVGQVVEGAFDQAEARDPAHTRTWVVLVDGDRYQIELIETEAGRRSVAVHLVIDLVHVPEYLWSAAWCFVAKDDPAAEDWVAEHALAILRGRSVHVASSIAQQTDEHRLASDRRGGVKQCVRYLENKEPCPCDEQALEQGWPIATGVVEGACWHLIADPSDITGSRCSVQGAEAVLGLHTMIGNGDFDEYWQFHAARERERLYPGAQQPQRKSGRPYAQPYPQRSANARPPPRTMSLRQ
jgi:hypothetical protein